MKKQTPHITDEHIVAYLDGELHVNQDFECELRANPELNQAAAEYTVIGKAIARSARDPRFMLSAQADARAQKALKEKTKTRSLVRTAAPAPNAAPVRPVPATRSIKYLWAKRAGIGLALASLLALLWVNFGARHELITQVPVPVMQSAPTPSVQAPASMPAAATANEQLASNTGSQMHQAALPVKKALVVSKNLASADLATNTTSPEAPRAATSDEGKTDPAAIMISHRYAKLIKSTPVLEITQQDRM